MNGGEDVQRISMAVAGVFLAVLGITELAFRTFSSEPKAGASTSCAVLVLGYPTRADGSLSAVQRFRTESGVRVLREQRCDQVIFTGAAVANRFVESDAMAAFARQLGVSDGAIAVEREATNTWENVGCSAPLLRRWRRVFVVSDSFHAARARRYACTQSVALCDQVIAAGINPPVSQLWWKVPAAVYESSAWLRDTWRRDFGSADAPACVERNRSRHPE